MANGPMYRTGGGTSEPFARLHCWLTCTGDGRVVSFCPLSPFVDTQMTPRQSFPFWGDLTTWELDQGTLSQPVSAGGSPVDRTLPYAGVDWAFAPKGGLKTSANPSSPFWDIDCGLTEEVGFPCEATGLGVGDEVLGDALLVKVGCVGWEALFW